VAASEREDEEEEGIDLAAGEKRAKVEVDG
jgi:hypothetical protein